MKVLVGFDEDLAAEATRLSNRIRDLLTQIHPALERVLGPRLTTKQGLALIEQLGGPQGMAAATESQLLRVIAKAYPRGAQDFADAITAALAEQTVTVAGTAAAGQVLYTSGDFAQLRVRAVQGPRAARLARACRRRS